MTPTHKTKGKQRPPLIVRRAVFAAPDVEALRDVGRGTKVASVMPGAKEGHHGCSYGRETFRKMRPQHEGGNKEMINIAIRLSNFMSLFLGKESIPHCTKLATKKGALQLSQKMGVK